MIINTNSIFDTKTVFEKRGIKIVRERGYGFRCNSMSTSWCVYSGDKPSGSYDTLKRAKIWAEYLARVVV
jgi:hypothetical protein